MKAAFHPSRFLAVSMIAVLAGMLASCGQKGPLYLPAKPAPVAKPATTPTPSPATAPADAAVPASK